jgi:lipoate---protein ligase
MKYLDLTFQDAASNLACDEALLELFETGQLEGSLLRLWESTVYFIVLGHSNRLCAEVNLSACTMDQIPILRRISGGGAVMQGPGCLNYSLVLDCGAHRVKTIGESFRYVLERHRRAIGRLAAGIEARADGTSDLTISGRKFSGNAQYRKARFVLVHGTFLLDFDLAIIERYLRMPAKQPAYRRQRPHLEFVANLKVASGPVRARLRDAWTAEEVLTQVPRARIEELVHRRYGQDAWSRKF